MRRKLTGGHTSVAVPIFIKNTSGAGLAGLVYNTAGLVAEYRREGGTWQTFALAAGTLGTPVANGFVADGDVAGAYELYVPDAALAAGSARWVIFRLKGAAGMAPLMWDMELDKVDYSNNTSFGLSRLDAAISSLPSGAQVANAVWNQLDASITLANSIGLRIKNFLDVAVSSRLATAGYTAPDNAGISTAATQATNAAASGALNTTLLSRIHEVLAAALSEGQGLAVITNPTATTLTFNSGAVVTGDVGKKVVFLRDGRLTGGVFLITNVAGTTATFGDFFDGDAEVGDHADPGDTMYLLDDSNRWLSTMIEFVSGAYRFKDSALAEAPTGSGGGTPPDGADVDLRFEPVEGVELAAGSVEYLKVKVDAFIGSRHTDATLFPLEFAFRAQGSTDALAWHDAEWDTESQARLLVGPDQAIVFVPGLYEWWVRVVAAPETTLVRLPQFLRVY